MNIDQHGSLLSDYIYYHTAHNKVFFTRCHDYLAQRDDRPSSYAEEMLCDGPLASYYAPFYLAWHLGLLPVKDGHACNETPVFYDIPGAGFDRIPEGTEMFIEIMVDLISNPKVGREAVSMMIEFHDFLAVRDRAQALRFITDIVEDYASRYNNVRDLLCRRGEDECLQHSEGFDTTLKEALTTTGWLEKGLVDLPARGISQAYRRLRWPEMARLASEADLEHVFSADLGL